METSPTIKLTELPEDMLLHIMSLFNTYDLSKLGATCKLLHTLSQSNSIWIKFCQKGKDNVGINKHVNLWHRKKNQFDIKQIQVGYF